MMRVFQIALLLLLLPACSSNPVPVIQTEFVEVEVCSGKYVPIPDDLTITTSTQKQPIPAGITYRELLQLLMVDRANLVIANGKLEAIRELSSD